VGNEVEVPFFQLGQCRMAGFVVGRRHHHLPCKLGGHSPLRPSLEGGHTLARRHLVAGKQLRSRTVFCTLGTVACSSSSCSNCAAKAVITLVSSAAICSFIKENEQKYFLLQLMPSEASAASDSSPQQMDRSAAHTSQKLERALQLTRTVALDFNNALTGILGHTSLVLSQIEPNHPWRASLLEVGKSSQPRRPRWPMILACSAARKKSPAANWPPTLNLLAQTDRGTV
jgi:hypothetical protein